MYVPDMPAVQQQVTPGVLAWAMRQAGMDVAALSASTGIDGPQIQSWIHGRGHPNKGQLRLIADKLHRSTSFFFLSEPPVSSFTQAEFRTPIGLKGPRESNPEEARQVRKAARYQRIASWSAEAAEADTYVELPRRDIDPEVSARRLREFLAWDIRVQYEALSKSELYKKLRLSLEEHGILVLQQSMGEHAARGFSIPHPRVPAVAINSTRQAPAARSFTLLHEMGHLVCGERAICDLPNSDDERWCDQFAAAFLLPRQALASYLLETLHKDWVDSRDLNTLKRVSERFKASYQCSALRLFEIGRAEWALYEFTRRNFVESSKGRSKEPATTPIVRLREYGTTYARLVLSARDNNKLPEIEARRYLNVNEEELKTVRQRLTRGE